MAIKLRMSLTSKSLFWGFLSLSSIACIAMEGADNMLVVGNIIDLSMKKEDANSNSAKVSQPDSMLPGYEGTLVGLTQPNSLRSSPDSSIKSDYSLYFLEANHKTIEKEYSIKFKDNKSKVTGLPNFVLNPSLSSKGEVSFQLSPDGIGYLPVILDKKGDLHQLIDRENGSLKFVFAQDPSSFSPDGKSIAYFGRSLGEGLITPSEFELGATPRKIYVQNWSQSQRLLVDNAQGAVAPLHWMGDDKVIYGALEKRARNYEEGELLPRPNIYSYSINEERITLLIRDGYKPVPSPNGEWIAFYGSRDLQNPVSMKNDSQSFVWLWRYISNGASLCVARPNGTQRIALQPYYGLYPRLQWLPNSEQFVSIELTRSGTESEAQLTLWDLPTQNRKPLTKLTVKDEVDESRNDLYDRFKFPFYPMGVTSDSKYVVIKSIVRKRQAAGSSQPAQCREILQKVSLDTGEVIEMASLDASNGLDWTSEVNYSKGEN